MSASDQVDIKISDDLIQPIIAAKIQAAIVASLGEESSLVDKAVSCALGLKVNHEGKISRYDSDNKLTLLEAMCRKAIIGAAREALDEWLSENKPRLMNAVKKHISKSPTKFAKMFVDGMAESLKSKWTFSVKILGED